MRSRDEYEKQSAETKGGLQTAFLCAPAGRTF